MALDLAKMTDAYMTLWKALDAFFPGREILEITEEPLDEIIEELQMLSQEELAKWSPDPGFLKKEIENTLARAAEKNKDKAWYNEARILKDFFRDKALSYAAQLPDPPARYLTARHP